MASEGKGVFYMDDMIALVMIHGFSMLQRLYLDLTLDVKLLLVLYDLEGNHFLCLVVKCLADLTERPFSE
jgi:hypothetical protein